MKNLSITLFYVLFLSTLLLAQAPQTLNYQAVARDGSGNPIVNDVIGLRLSILDGSETGTVAYQETFSPSTNQFGLFTVNIGTGTVSSGNFSNINWGSGSKWLKTEVDVAGGTNYIVIGSTQFVSVPYALYAENSKSYIAGAGITILGDTITSSVGDNQTLAINGNDLSISGGNTVTLPVSSGITGSGTSNYIPKFNSGNSIITSQIYDDGNYVGIGTTSPTDKLQIEGRIRQNQPYNGTSYYMNITGGANGMGIWHSGNSGIPLQVVQSSSNTSSNTVLIGNEGTGRTMEIQQNNSSNSNSMIYILKSGTGKVIDVSNGAFLSNGGVWTNASDKSLKENFTLIDKTDLLSKIDQLPITIWNYKNEPNVKHIGPMSQDFYKLFGVGNDDKTISTIDPVGVALSAIKELNKKIKELEELKMQVEDLQNRLNQLELK